MIKYNLLCKKCELTFDSWFASSKEYDKLKNKEINLIVESQNQGRSDTFAKVCLDDNFEAGKIIKMLVTGKRQEGLIGNIIV